MQPPYTVFTAPPRELWINPVRRTQAIVISVVAAVALLFVGGIGGAVIVHHHDNRIVRLGPGGPFSRQLGPNGAVPPFGRFAPRRNAPAPTPTPSTSS